MEQLVLVDESKVRDYLLVAAIVRGADVAQARSTLQSLHLSRQKYIHMVKERPGRQRGILEGLRAVPATFVVYRAARATWRTDLAGREQCMRALVYDLNAGGPTRVLLDRDTGVEQADRRWIREAVNQRGITDLVRYDHGKAAQEPLLALPDIVGWAMSKGGTWRAACRGIVSATIDV